MKKKIIISNLSQMYEGKEVLYFPSLTIYSEEKIAIIGSSGAGKSTFLNILSGNNQTYSGDIIIDEKNILEYIEKNILYKKIGIVRQQFDLVEELSVLNNVLAGKLGEWGFFKSLFSLFFPQEKQEAEEALSSVGLDNFLYRKTSTLSGGEKQRVAIARILLQNSEIILADEPVASLDPKRARNILGILKKVTKKQNKTLIVSLHSVDLAKEFFDRIIGLKDGKIYFDLKSSELTEEYLSTLYAFQGMQE